MGWAELSSAAHAEARQVVRLWHPDAEGSLFHLKNGVNAEVFTGPAAYQVSDGTIVADF